MPIDVLVAAGWLNWLAAKSGEALFSHIVVKSTEVSLEDARDRVSVAMESGKLPPNHVWERAILRAAVLALRHCLDADTAAAMSDAPPPASGYRSSLALGCDQIRAIFAPNKALARAYRWLNQTSDALAHARGNSDACQETIQALIAALAPDIGNSSGYAIREIAELPVTTDQAEALAKLMENLVARLVAQGDWPDGELAGTCLLAACRDGQRWGHAFSHHYAQELKNDPKLQVIVETVSLATLQAGQADLATLLEAQFAAMGVEIKAAAAQAGNGMEAWALANVFQRSEDRITGDDNHFLRALDEFIGREEDLSTIEHLLFTDDAAASARFLWMAVCGEGGTGKSRLCQQLIDRAPDWGFVNAGFVDKRFVEDANRVGMVADRLGQNTLLILDYSTHVADHLPRFMADWTRYASADAARPRVRLVLILRNKDDPVFTHLASLSAYDQGPAIERAERRPADGRLTLKHLSDDETVALMRQRIERVAAEAGQPVVARDRQELLDLLGKFDRLMRPLFALIVAEALQKGDLWGIDEDGSREAARLALFQTYLKRQRDNYWEPQLRQILHQPTDGSHSDSDLIFHENAVRLSTAMMGIDLADYRALRASLDTDIQGTLPEGGGRGPAGPAAIKRALVRSITGVDLHQANRAERLAPLEPDLIGEYFVLRGDAMAREHGCALSVEEVLELAYRQDPARTTHFLRMMVQDFPTSMTNRGGLAAIADQADEAPDEALDAAPDVPVADEPADEPPFPDIPFPSARARGRASLLPRPVEAAEIASRAQFLRDICADLGVRADPDVRESEELDVLDYVMRELKALDALGGADDAYGLNRAHILLSIVTLAGNAINANISIADGMPPAEAEETAGASVTQSFGNAPDKQGGTPRPGATLPRKGMRSADAVLDPEQVMRADGLARWALQQSWDALFTPQSPEAFDLTSEAVAKGLSSLLWHGRGDPEQGGRHPEKMTPLDIAWRQRMRETLQGVLRDTNLPRHRSASVKLLAALSYAFGKGTRADAMAILAYGYAAPALAALADWSAFADTLGSLNNVVVGLLGDSDDDNANGEDILRLAIEAQGRLVARGVELLPKLLADARTADTEIKRSARMLTNALTVFEAQFADPAYAGGLQRSWMQVAALIGPNLARFQIENDLLVFLVIPTEHGFASPDSDVIGMDFDNVLPHLLPLLRAGRIDCHQFRHHYRDNIGYFVDRYALTSRGAEEDVRAFLDEMDRQIGSRFRVAAWKTMAGYALAMPIERVPMVRAWLWGDSSTTPPLLAADGQLAAAIYAIWSRDLFDGHTHAMRAQLETLWAQDGPAEDPVRARTLALRGMALLASHAGSDADPDGRLAGRVQQLIAARAIDFASEAARPATLRQAMAEYDDAIVEAAMALVTNAVAAGDDLERWIPGEGWSMNFASVKELDRRLIGAMLERMKESDDLAMVRSDFARIRRLSIRNADMLLPALEAILDKLPENDAERAALTAERDAVAERLKAEQPAGGGLGGSGAPTAYDRLAPAMSDAQRTRMLERADAMAHWHLPPPFVWDWEPVTGAALAAMVDRARAAMPRDNEAARLDLLEAIAARRVAMPCYSGHELAEILIERDGMLRSLSLVMGPDAATWLDGRSLPIHQLNNIVPINLANGVFADLYLGFFCAYVHGEEGPFRILPSPADIDVYRAGGWQGGPYQRIIDQAFAELAEREQNQATSSGSEGILTTDDTGRVRRNAVIAYDQQLVIADFAIADTGMVEMLDDNPVGPVALRGERYVAGWRVATEG